jgi:hypothetical protein
MASKHAGSSSECIETIHHSKIKATDKGTGRAIILLNPAKEKARRIRVDHCLAPHETKAADFIISMPNVVDVIIELKKGDVAHATEQIESTWNFWRGHAEHVTGQPIGAWILCSEYPRASLKVNRYRESFRTRGAVLLISTHNGEERSFVEFLPR